MGERAITKSSAKSSRVRTQNKKTSRMPRVEENGNPEPSVRRTLDSEERSPESDARSSLSLNGVAATPPSQAGFASAAARSPDPRSDRQLLDAARRGDAEAFAAIYRRHGPWLLSLARRWTCSEHDAPDLVQDSFLCLLSSPPNLKFHGPLPPYLSRVAWNCFMKRLRTDRRRTRRERACAREATLSAGTSVQDLVESLTPCQRQVIVLHYREVRTIAEIAELLGWPQGTVKSRLHKGLQALREKVGILRNRSGGLRDLLS